MEFQAGTKLPKTVSKDNSKQMGSDSHIKFGFHSKSMGINIFPKVVPFARNKPAKNQ